MDDDPLRGLADVLAQVSHDPEDARAMAKRAGFPPERLPKFETAIEFWTKIIEGASHGRIDARALVDEVAGQFPHNPDIQEYRARLIRTPTRRRSKTTPDRAQSEDGAASHPPTRAFHWGAWTPTTLFAILLLGTFTSLGLGFFAFLLLVVAIMLFGSEVRVVIQKDAAAVTLSATGLTLSLYQATHHVTAKEAKEATTSVAASSTLAPSTDLGTSPEEGIRPQSEVPHAIMGQVTPSDWLPSDVSVSTTGSLDATSDQRKPTIAPRSSSSVSSPPDVPEPPEPRVEWLTREPTCRGKRNEKGDRIGYDPLSMLDCVPRSAWHCKKSLIKHREAFQMTAGQRAAHNLSQWFPDLLDRLADQTDVGLNVIYLEQCCTRYGLDRDDDGPRRKFEKCCVGANYSVFWTEGEILARSACKERPFYGLSSLVARNVPFYQHKDIPLVLPYR